MKNFNYLFLIILTGLVLSCEKEKEKAKPVIPDYTLRMADYNKSFVVGRDIVLTELTGGFTPFTMDPILSFDGELENATYGTSTKVLKVRSGSAVSGSLFCLEETLSTANPSNPLIVAQNYTERRYFSYNQRNGISETHRSITPYSITLNTGINSIAFPSQLRQWPWENYFSPALPAGLGSSNSSSGTSLSYGFKLTSDFAGLNNVPCELSILSLDEEAKYLAYGDINLPGYPKQMPVAIIKRTSENQISYIDSMTGSIPQIVLTPFGLTQNETIKSTYYDVFNIGGIGLVARFYEGNDSSQPVRVFVLKK